MKQSIFFAAVLWLLSLPVAAQSSLEQVLQQVESHNPELQAGGQRARSDSYLQPSLWQSGGHGFYRRIHPLPVV